MFSFGQVTSCWKQNQKIFWNDRVMAVWSHAIHRPSTQWPNFDPAYLNIVAAGVRSVFSRSGSFFPSRLGIGSRSDSVAQRQRVWLQIRRLRVRITSGSNLFSNDFDNFFFVTRGVPRSLSLPSMLHLLSHKSSRFAIQIARLKGELRPLRRYFALSEDFGARTKTGVHRRMAKPWKWWPLMSQNFL